MAGALFALLCSVPALAQGTLFIGTWPHTLQVIDEAKQQVVDKIDLATGVANGMQICAGIFRRVA